MKSRTALKKVAGGLLHSIAFVTIANGVGALDLWHSPNAWAQQTVAVSPGDNLQALVNEYPPSTTFSFSPGVYRLQSAIPQNNDSFVGQPGAILSGATVLTTFNRSGSYWTSPVHVTQARSYPGQCNSASPACAFPEDLFFNNTAKTRVASLSLVGPGTWYLNYSTGTAYMGDNPAGSTVEMSELPYAFTGGAASVQISNLTIEKYASLGGTGAIDGAAGSSYWQIEGNEIRYNHGRGITSGNGMYIYKNNIHHNGQLGIGGGGTNISVQNNQISYNNYAGYSYYWEAGGAKFGNVETLVVQYNYSYNNAGPGLSNALNSEGVTYDENETSGNMEAGILSELSSNITVSGNYIFNDGSNPSGSGPWWGAGILIVDSSTVSVRSNTVINCMNGIVGVIANRGAAPDGQPFVLQNLSVEGNSITQTTGTAAGIAIDGGTISNEVYINMNNIFTDNAYVLANPAGDYFYWAGQPMTLAEWAGTLAGAGSAAAVAPVAGAAGVTVSISSSSLTFGSEAADTSSSPKTVTLTNTGGAALSITSIGFTGANPADFTENNNCGSSVAAGSSCAITASFTPTAAGSLGASLVITDNAGGSPQSITVSGTGTHDVTLTWKPSVSSGVIGYDIHRGTTSGGESSAPLNSSPVSSDSFVDTNVQAGLTYYYVVTAVGSNGTTQSADSNEATAAVPSP